MTEYLKIIPVLLIKILKTVIRILYSVLWSLFILICNIITSHPIVKILLGAYIGISIYLRTIKPLASLIMVIILISVTGFHFLYSFVYILSYSYGYRRKRSEHNSEDHEKDDTYPDNTSESTVISFIGLSRQEAKEKYRRLLKKYHPDNKGGSLSKAKEITTAYREYCINNK